MFLYLFMFLCFFNILSVAYVNDYQDITYKNYLPVEQVEFEPVTVLTKEKEKYVLSKSINCDEFSRFALNCTVEAAFIYNSTRISPPFPEKIGDWCKAIKHLVNCAIDWNADCKDITPDHFNEEGINGHIHVIKSICDDEWFLTQYLELSTCVENKASLWESCYLIFKKFVEREKNTTHEWTHYDTHFNLCCARAEFRRCTLETIFQLPTKCSYENAVTLQKFSVIISEGAVYQSQSNLHEDHKAVIAVTPTRTSIEIKLHGVISTIPLYVTNQSNPIIHLVLQDCDRNMMYSNCPGGDPRPSRRMLTKLMSSDAFNKACLLSTNLWIITLFILTAC